MFDLVVLVTAFLLVLTTPGITGAKAGFIIGFATNVTNEFSNFLVCAREWDLKGVTLERLAEYRNLDTEHIPSFVSDKQNDTNSAEPHSYDRAWPRTGSIEVTGLHARYAPDLPDVLSNVSFSVAAGERVGIVGATGCGKSTLAKAFFSFVDVTEGSIRVDGQGTYTSALGVVPHLDAPDLKQLPLDVARGRLGIIGQDPMLVTGSLRLNLNVEGDRTDEELVAVLRRISLLGDAVEFDEANGTETQHSSVTAVGHDPAEAKNRNVFEDLDYEIVNAGDKYESSRSKTSPLGG